MTALWPCDRMFVLPFRQQIFTVLVYIFLILYLFIYSSSTIFVYSHMCIYEYECLQVQYCKLLGFLRHNSKISHVTNCIFMHGYVYLCTVIQRYNDYTVV